MIAKQSKLFCIGILDSTGILRHVDKVISRAKKDIVQANSILAFCSAIHVHLVELIGELLEVKHWFLTRHLATKELGKAIRNGIIGRDVRRRVKWHYF